MPRRPSLPPDAELLAALRAGARRHRPATLELPRRAAVAVVLREAPAGPEVLLVRRTERPGDPWSGQMAVPGGRVEPQDRSPLQAAMRECLEEVGLDLRHDGELLGPLREHRVFARGRPTDMAVSPFLFLWRGEGSPRTGPEVAEWLWTPLGPLLRGERDARYRYRLKLVGIPLPVDLPAYDVEGRRVWGLTYRILRSLHELLRG